MIEDWVRRIRDGDARALARAATAVENRRPEAIALMKALFPHTGRAVVAGITGPPGVGKSTLAGALARALRTEALTVGIVAVDPTSPFTGGAILGDRIRMLDHHADPGVFIRSMATRGALGGLAAATMDVALLLDAAGRDFVLVETVGVGQDEVEVARLAGVTAVVLVPGMGDDVQAIKAGIMEIADVFVINKADHPGAAQLERELRGIAPQLPIVRTVASTGEGVNELLAALRRVRRETAPASLWRIRLREMLRERLLDRLGEDELAVAAEEVASRRRDPYSVVEDWLGQL